MKALTPQVKAKKLAQRKRKSHRDSLRWQDKSSSRQWPNPSKRRYRLCDLREDLGPLQPNLEFLNEHGEWVKSGIITGRVSQSSVGRYRTYSL
jgi:hypothetical protein